MEFNKNDAISQESVTKAVATIVGGTAGVFFGSMVNDIANSARSPIIRLCGRVASLSFGAGAGVWLYEMTKGYIMPAIYNGINKIDVKLDTDNEPDGDR